MCVLNVKTLLGALDQEKALVGAFSVIVKSSRTYTFAALLVAGGGMGPGIKFTSLTLSAVTSPVWPQHYTEMCPTSAQVS